MEARRSQQRNKTVLGGSAQGSGASCLQLQMANGELWNTQVPIARLIAANDEDVPEKYWRYDQVSELPVWESIGLPNRIQVVARSGYDGKWSLNLI